MCEVLHGIDRGVYVTESGITRRRGVRGERRTSPRSPRLRVKPVPLLVHPHAVCVSSAIQTHRGVCTCARGAQHGHPEGVHMYAARAALRHRWCARVRRPRSIATPRVRTCTPPAQRCDTDGAHVYAARAALRHRWCARVRRPRSIATQVVRTCTPPAQHCDTEGAHVHTALAAVRRGCVTTRNGRVTTDEFCRALYFLWKCFSMSRWRMSTMIGRPWGQA